MHFIYKPEMLPFDFLHPEDDKVFDFCLRNLLWTDPEQLRGFMGPDPTQSTHFAEFGESGFECRLQIPEVQEMFKDWPKWAYYKATAYDFQGQDRAVNFYTKKIFESHIREGLRQYIRTFPEKQTQINQLVQELELGPL